MDEHGNGGVVINDDDDALLVVADPFLSLPLTMIEVEGMIQRGCASPAIPTRIEDEPSSIMMGDVCLLLDVVVTWASFEDEILYLPPTPLPPPVPLESADAEGNIMDDAILWCLF